MVQPQLELVKNRNADKPGFTILPISRLFPNMITLMALCSGMFAIRSALNEKWELAVAFIFIAAFLDVMDGRLARLLKATSNFGAQLDSLADFLNFGVAPSLVLYLWSLNQISTKGMGWGIALFYTVCCAIRLARFNTSLEDENRPAWLERFFVGVPSTAGACLVLIPMMLSFHYDIYEIASPVIIGVYTAIVAILLPSRLPTFSTKKLVIRREYSALVLAVTGLLITSMLIEPWLTLSLLGMLYFISIPVSLVICNKIKNTAK